VLREMERITDFSDARKGVHLIRRSRLAVPAIDSIGRSSRGLF
jgi:hypothetical protein